MSDYRKRITDIVREAIGSLGADDVAIYDDAADRVGIPRDGEQQIRHINQKGVDLIKSFEGLRLKAYRDAVGVLTIGYGSTGDHVFEGMVITENQAEALLKSDLSRFEKCVERAAPGLSDNRFAACVSLAFNIGCKAFEGSSVCRLARSGDHGAAQRSFGLWNKAGGKVLAGLVRRRAAEAELYGS